MDNFPTFADSLTELMTIRDISPTKLATAISVNVDTIYSWKNNSNSPTLANLIALSDYFLVPLDFLAGRSNKTEPFQPLECPPFYKRLREVMENRGISTYYLRTKTKFKASNLWKWSRGADPLLPTLIDLAKILDCSIDYLVGRER